MPILDHRNVCTIKTIKTPPIHTVLCPLFPEILQSGPAMGIMGTLQRAGTSAPQKCLKYQVPASCTHPHHFLLLFILEHWTAGLGTHQYTLEDHGKQDAEVRRRLLAAVIGAAFICLGFPLQGCWLWPMKPAKGIERRNYIFVMHIQSRWWLMLLDDKTQIIQFGPKVHPDEESCFWC